MIGRVESAKAIRHAKILEIIGSRSIETQEELAQALRSQGIDVTQATVSRDIKELRLTKLPTGDGGYRYAVAHEQAIGDVLSRLEHLFHDSVVSLDYSENLLVIKTLTGNAHAVADVIDDLNWKEILGTIAGDDTILVVVRPKSAVPELLERFNKLRG
ncbi:MAG TPA: arginine repressor [Firmicutes bacterium]|nr:arginine repressor [Bacillota bacterium]